MKNQLLWICALALCFAPACKSNPQDYEEVGTRAELDEQLDKALKPMVDTIAAKARGRRLSFPGIYETRTGRIIPASTYLEPRITRALGERRLSILNRLDLDKIIEEQIFLTSEFIEPDALQRIGEVNGAELLLLCPAISPTGREYQLDWKLVEIESGETVDTGLVTFERTWLPLNYGGVL